MITKLGGDVSVVKLLDLLPDGLKNYNQLKWLSVAVQPEIDEISEIIKTKILFTYLENLDDLTLDYLLLETGIAKSIEIVFIESRQDKINFIQDYVRLNKLRGTVEGIEYVLKLVGVEAIISEWYEYGGDPYTFKITLDNTERLSPEQIKQLSNLVKAYKNTRSHFSYDDIKQFDDIVYGAGIMQVNHIVEFEFKDMN